MPDRGVYLRETVVSFSLQIPIGHSVDATLQGVDICRPYLPYVPKGLYTHALDLVPEWPWQLGLCDYMLRYRGCNTYQLINIYSV